MKDDGGSYTYETTRQAIERLGMGPVWEMAMEEDGRRDHDPALPGERESRAEFRRDMDHAEAIALAQADGDDGAPWDLLLDYDRVHDVPGMIVGLPFQAHFDDQSLCVIEVKDAGRPGGCPPDWDGLYSILAARLARAGYMIDAWEYGPSTNAWHVKVRLEPHPPPIESVALQAICGSDPLRESCNLERARMVELWARGLEEGDVPGGHEAAEFWRTRWNVLYHTNPDRKAKI